MTFFAASNIAERAEDVLGSRLRDAGYSLVLCEWSGRGSHPELWVYIELLDGADVGINDCVEAHHAITDVLDVEDFIPGAYKLQVSSPGLDRPLRKSEHFSAQLGNTARVRTWEPIAGRRNWKGKVEGVEDDIVTLLVDGQAHRIPLPAIEKANLVFEFKAGEKMKGGGTRTKRSVRQ
jgi:ribosome maturation factor RimP